MRAMGLYVYNCYAYHLVAAVTIAIVVVSVIITVCATSVVVYEQCNYTSAYSWLHWWHMHAYYCVSHASLYVHSELCSLSMKENNYRNNESWLLIVSVVFVVFFAHNCFLLYIIITCHIVLFPFPTMKSFHVLLIYNMNWSIVPI